MKKTTIAIWMTAFSLLAGFAPAYAGCEGLSTTEQIEKADLIFIGKPTGKEYVGYRRAKTQPGGEDAYANEHGETPLWKWKLTRFTVEQTFKGQVENEITVVSPRFFTLGSTYIVFATRADNKDRFDKTTAAWANTPCDPTDVHTGENPPSLEKEVEHHFGAMRMK